MKIPRNPPTVRGLSQERLSFVLREARKTEADGRYRHWDVLRHLVAPAGLSVQEWWTGTKLTRMASYKELPLLDAQGEGFLYTLPNPLLEELFRIDQGLFPSPLSDPHDQGQHLIRSLIQEAITSSQLEGAATTRSVAKEMITTGRKPLDTNERMILNNFHAMQSLKEWKERPLDPALIFEIHRQITEDTLDKSDGAGRFRKSSEKVAVIDATTNEVVYDPPPAGELEGRLKEMCDFANGKTPDHFIHPLVRAMILHFWLAYDHPFVDGNGRTARTLFYWLALRSGYWIFEYISISEVLLSAPVQYGRAFLYTETDGNDMTYFLLHQSKVIQKALKSLCGYIEEKENELKRMRLIRGDLNLRQEALLIHALKNPGKIYTIEEHKTSHKVAYDTARQDLMKLASRGLFAQKKRGKAYVFQAPEDLGSLLTRMR